jgi:hypothetical protein
MAWGEGEMRNFLCGLALGALVGALAISGLVFADTSSVSPYGAGWLGVPPLAQTQLNTALNGQEGYGQAAVTCSTNGNFTITHGMTGTPTVAFIEELGDDATNSVELQAISSTTLTGRCFAEATGADVTSGSITVVWYAKVAP